MKLSVIMPVFNGEKFIVENTKRVEEILKSYVSKGLIQDYEIVVVDDGSNDKTVSLLNENFSKYQKVIIIQNKFNQGKGFALKNGFFNSTGDVIVMIDSDLDIPPEQIENLINEYQNGYDVVITSKFEKGSQLKYPLFRRIVSLGFYILSKILFGLPFKDTQTGLKLFRREVLEVCLSRMVVKRFAFDLELLLIAYRYNFLIKPIPVKINYHSSGFISPKVLLMSFIDTLAIFYRLRILQYYDRPVFISKSQMYNFYFPKDDQNLEGINCPDKSINELTDRDFVILKRYDINKNLDISVLTSVINSYRVEIINGVSIMRVINFRGYILSSIAFSRFLNPLFNLKYKVVTPRILPIPLSNFLCVSARVFKYLVNRQTKLNDEVEVIRNIHTRYNSVLFIPDWTHLNEIGGSIFYEFPKSLHLLFLTGNISSLFALGVFFTSVWASFIYGMVFNLWFTLPFLTFFGLYLILKIVLSGLKFIVIFPFFLIFSFIISTLGILSPLITLAYRKFK